MKKGQYQNMYSYQIGNGVNKALKINQDKINSLPEWIRKNAKDHYTEKLTELCKHANENEDYIITGKVILGIGNEVTLWAESMDRQYKINPSLEETNEKIGKLAEEVDALKKEIEKLKVAVEKLGAALNPNESPSATEATANEEFDVEADEEPSDEYSNVEISSVANYDAKFETLYYLLKQLHGLN